LTGQRVYAAFVVTEAGSIIRVPRSAVNAIIETDATLGELLVQTLFRRREALLLLRSGMQLIGSRYSPDTQRRAVIQLSLRHKSNDHFWFTFFHEAGHVLAPTRRREFIDPADYEAATTGDADEEAANRFARDLLLPPRDYEEFVDRADFSASAVRAFAQNQKVAPGIVVGRLQRDRLLPRSHLNDLKKPIQWPTPTGSSTRGM
jgi:hypothetical protein